MFIFFPIKMDTKNSYFQIVHETIEDQNYCYILLLPTSNAQAAMDALGEYILQICLSPEKRSIVLDCLQLKNHTRLAKLKLGRLLQLGHSPPGLHKFCIVTTSKLIQTFTKGIIKLTKAQEYTHSCKSVEDALRLIVSV